MNFFKKLSKKWIVAILIGCFLLVFIILSIIAVNKDKVEIVDVNNYPSSIPEDMHENIGIQLRNLLSLHFDVKKGEKISGVVRDGTYRENYDFDSDIYSAIFILDVDQYKQSYQIDVSWSNDEEVEIPDGIIISCAADSQTKYPNEKCYGMYDGDSDDSDDADDQTKEENNYRPLDFLLPYSATTESGIEIYATVENYYESTSHYVHLSVGSCGDETKTNEGLTFFKNYLKSNNLNPDDYTITTQSTCDGEAE